jgi:hypothetical protein
MGAIMGMFDTYYARCPNCECINSEQSKAGPCICGNYNIDNAKSDAEVAMAFDGLSFVCDNCGTKFRTVNKAVPQIVVELDEDISDD